MEALILDLTLILVVAGAVTLLFKKLKQPLVLGYIVAGFLVSPHMPYLASVVDKENIQTWADIGVLFLLFALGLDFSFKKILKMGMAPAIAACSIVFSMMLLGTLVGKAFGWSQMNCIFLGGMLAMSSTTIIYKAFDDMGLRQQRFASLVMSVLILEDVLAIVMMVMLSTIAGTSASPADGGGVGQEILMSTLRLGFILILWFVVGIFLIPLFLRKTRKLMTDEMLVIIALGLCFLMAVIATQAGFSSAFGAFVMGSILAETIEADKIIRLVEPVKNLFGAVFFVSVGMLVDPQILVTQWLPIIVLTLTILFGQAVFGSTSYMLSGQPLKTAMRCGFSMAQIGEFAFIIASLGLTLGVIGDFLYPIVVAVSVVTTFLTPYMIRAADPAYELLERRMPKQWLRRLNHLGESHHATASEQNLWKRLLTQISVNTVIYSILSSATIALMFTVVKPFFAQLLPESLSIFGFQLSIINLLTGLLAVLFISPFLRAMIMKKNHSQEFRALWMESRMNRPPLVFTVLARIFIAAAFIFYVVNHLSHFKSAFIVAIALVAIVVMVMSRSLKHRSIKLERMFVQNLRSKEIQAQVQGRKKPLFEGHLLDRDIHITDFIVPDDSAWTGHTLSQLNIGQRFGVHVSSILRGRQRLNIPTGDTVIFPGDRIQVIGSDDQLQHFATVLRSELIPEDAEIEKREMHLRKIVLDGDSPFIGKTLKESGLREEYNCMVVGIEEGQQDLTIIDANHLFEHGDIVWVVGEDDDLKRLNEIKS
ncbi:MAG: cation:proton antiporter [Prevotella sp.]|nr:cation:proton antiporter [Prevotella sp.]